MFLHLKKKTTDPPGGWFYVCEYDAFRLKAGTFDKLLEKVKQHYDINNKEHPEDLAAVVEDQICRRIPASLVKEDIYDRIPTERTITTVTKAVADKARREREKVDADIFESRMQICKACPSHNWRHGCYECSMAYKYTPFPLGGFADSAKSVRACDITYSLCSVMCMLSKDSLVALFSSRTDAIENLDENCWLKPLLENDNG